MGFVVHRGIFENLASYGVTVPRDVRITKVVILSAAVPSAEDDLLVLFGALDVEPVWRVVQDVDYMHSRASVQTFV